MADSDEASSYDYDLPEDRIRLVPPPSREESRLAVVPREGGSGDEIRFGRISDLPEILRRGDRLVLNDSRVIPARVKGLTVRGREVELLFLGPFGSDSSGPVRLLAKGIGREPRIDLFSGRGEISLSGYVESEGCFVGEYRGENPLETELEREGEMPLPPYIAKRRRADSSDRERYQTVYSKVPGSVAAPTAGLHLGTELVRSLSEAGIGLSFVTLHVGLGTFRPLSEGRVETHQMHAEWFSVSEQTVSEINETRKLKGRVVAVGTTSLRAIESSCDWTGGAPTILAKVGWTDLFIRRGHRFGPVDGLLTNFHTPRSTLLVLVDTFLGSDGRWREIYSQALSEGFHYLSYGDAMLIL